MQIRPTAFTIGLIIYSFIALFFVYTEFGIDSSYPTEKTPQNAEFFQSDINLPSDICIIR